MQRQLGLLGGTVPRFDPEFTRLVRTELGDGAFVDHVPGWVAGQDTLFDRLHATTRWRSESRPMYDRVVAVPRLIAVLSSPDVDGDGEDGPSDGDGDPILFAMRTALSARYREDFVRISLALYRDGKDSVAFHGDTTARDLPEATVATVSLGEPRRLLLRPTAGGRSVASFLLGHGDLFVMGGTCQRAFRHAVPKVAAAGPRMAVMFRPVWTPLARTST
jgi:alkylated DNA repair dioxygenase AlkB